MKSRLPNPAAPSTRYTAADLEEVVALGRDEIRRLAELVKGAPSQRWREENLDFLRKAWCSAAPIDPSERAAQEARIKALCRG